MNLACSFSPSNLLSDGEAKVSAGLRGCSTSSMRLTSDNQVSVAEQVGHVERRPQLRRDEGRLHWWPCSQILLRGDQVDEIFEGEDGKKEGADGAAAMDGRGGWSASAMGDSWRIPGADEIWERGAAAMNLRAICGRGQTLPWMAGDCIEESGARLPEYARDLWARTELP
jgi:hypothetical protein